MRVAIDSHWSFADAVAASRAAYIGNGVESTGRKLGVLRAWASVVGRERALAGIEAHRMNHRSDDEAARALRISKVSLRRLRKFFEEVPSAEPPGLTLFFPNTLDFMSKALVESVLALIVGDDTSACRSEYIPTENGGALVRLSGLPIEQLVGIADRLADFFNRPAKAEIMVAIETAIQPALDRAVERSLPEVVSRAIAPMAVLQAQLGERILGHIDSVYAQVKRTEITFSGELVEALSKMESKVIDSKLDQSGWTWDAAAGKLIRAGGWSVGTGTAGSALWTFFQWVSTLI